MSSTLWAIEAAKKNRKNDVVPGSSKFITAEMKTNVDIAKAGISTFNESLQTCVHLLNDIIDDINNGAPALLLQKVTQLSLANLDVKDEDSILSRTYSRYSRTDRSITEEISRPELKVELSEKIIRLAEPPILSPDRLTFAEPILPSVLNSEPKEQPSVPSPKPSFQQKPASAPKEVRIPLSLELTTTKTENILPSEPYEHDEIRLELPSSSPAISKLESGKIEDINTALSPIHIPRNTVALMSPNVDLSFIPIANSINPLKFDNAPNLKTELLEESDTSFQAISTAIRKSFAGKLSMGQFAGSLPLYSDYKDDTDARLNSQDIPSKRPETHAQDSKAISINSHQSRREKSIYTKRTSVFVALPDREPIAYLNSTRQSIKVKAEEAESRVRSLVYQGDLTSNNDNSNLHRYNTTSYKNSTISHRETNASEVGHNVASKLVNIARNLDLRFPGKTRAVQSPTERRLPVEGRSPLGRRSPTQPREKKRLNQSASSGNLQSGSIPRISPTRGRTQSRSPRAPSGRVRPSAQLQKSFSTRTTDSGSPSRKIRQSHGPFLSTASNAGSKFSLATDDASSSQNSRSPTKYNNRTDNESIRDSPTDYDSVTPLIKRDPEILQRLTLPTSASILKATKSFTTKETKEPQMKNRFLTTTLNPENPPHFAPKPQMKRPSPTKKDLSRGEKNKVARKIPPLKFEPSSRPKQKINLAISHKQDLRESTLKTDNPPTERLVTSPKKKERVTNGKQEYPQRKSIKRALEPLDIHVAPRKRAVGNAVPLPDAARGIFKGEQSKEKRKTQKALTTPLRHRAKSLTDIGTADSPGFRPDALPEIPSDDEALRKKKYLKSWAETPELLKVMKETKDLDPVTVFGDVPVLRMDDVFESAASRQRGMASPNMMS